MIHHQSVFDTWPIEDNSIQAIITSPPYWGLRKYDIPDIDIGVWKGQYGLEPSYLDYVEDTRLWMKEAFRVLKEDGILFLNIGDTYGTVSGSMGSGKYTDPKLSKEANEAQPKKNDINMHKCKLLIPHRIAIALIEDGWTLRNDILWVKPNAMPESAKDRFSKKFEYIFMFVKNEKYYFNLDAVRELQSASSIKRAEYAIRTNETYENRKDVKLGHEYIGTSPTRLGRKNMHINIMNQGKNPGDVWNINTQPSSEPHYAMWPSKLVERMILCSTKEGDIVLDPFAGSATTLKIAIKNNRKAIGIDLGYSDIQERKLSNIQKVLL